MTSLLPYLAIAPVVILSIIILSVSEGARALALLLGLPLAVMFLVALFVWGIVEILK